MQGLALYEAAVLLGIGLCFALLFRRVGLGPVLGFLMAGAFIGPSGFGLVGSGETKLAFAEFGIALLLFLVGLELNPERLWRLRRDIFGLGALQVAACGLILSLFVWVASRFTWDAALALGLPLALSSTAQVLPSLKSSGQINTPLGERAFSILLFQDLAIVPLITIIAALSRVAPEAGAPPGWLLVVYTLVAIFGLVLAGRYLISPVLRLSGSIGEREMFVFIGLFTVISASAVMHYFHLSTALGAFVAGVMLADSPYRHEIEADVEPFRAILQGLFFLAVGMVLDLSVIRAEPVFVFGMAAGLVILKVAVIGGLCRLFGMRWRRALWLGLLLSQGGEFAFVLFQQAQDAQLIRSEAASLFGAIVTLSMASTPFLMIAARKIQQFRPNIAANPVGPEAAEDRPNVIIVGAGRFGQTVSQLLSGQGVKVTMVDLKPQQIEMSGRFGRKVFYGDGRRIDLLRRAGGDTASLILYCSDDRSLGMTDLSKVQHSFPQAKLIVRAYDRSQLIEIDDKNIDVYRDVFESAIVVGKRALSALGVASVHVDEAEQSFRKRDAKRLAAQRKTGDIHALQAIHDAPREPTSQ